MVFDDTIAAIATALQPSGLGVIRVSGPTAVESVSPLFVRSAPGPPLEEAPSHQLIHGWIQEDTEPVDEVLVTVMRAPRSFTCEDVVEVQGHGSVLGMQTILGLIIGRGVRLARPGEFTQRAFINGRLDLTRVEAVADLTYANSGLGLKAAAQQLRGKLFQAIKKVKNEVAAVASLIEATIEFPDENAVFTERDECLRRLNHCCAELVQMLAGAGQGRRMREGIGVAIIGRPNVGKSSLLNSLLQEPRAIVTTFPGTTRDVIEESIQIRGLAFRFADTAGIRESKDPVESEGIRRSRVAWDTADLTLLVLDGSVALVKEDMRLLQSIEPERTLVVFNKSDLLSGKDPEWKSSVSRFESVTLSAKTGEGIEKLKDSLFRKSSGGKPPALESTWLTNMRQQQAAEKGLAALRLACEGLQNKIGEELLAVDLRSGLNALGEIVGETTADDLLERIFSEFCIGK